MSWYDDIIARVPGNEGKLRSVYQIVLERLAANSCKPYFEEMDLIIKRLSELAQMDFPQCRSYRKEDGTWVEYEPVLEYYEQQELISRWMQLSKYDKALCESNSNRLVISHRLNVLEHALSEDLQYDISLNWRIAVSVGYNTDVA